MYNSKLKFIIIPIVIAILVLSMALAICGIIFSQVKDALNCLLLLDRAGVGKRDVKDVIDAVDLYYETRESIDAVEGYATLVVDIASAVINVDGERFGNAIYTSLRKRSGIKDLYLFSKFDAFGNVESLKRIYFNIMKAQDPPSWSELDGLFEMIVKNAEELSQTQCAVVATNFVNLCKYVYAQGEEELKESLNTAKLAYQNRKQLSDKVSVRQLLNMVQYFSNGLLVCKDYKSTFGTLYQVSQFKIFDLLSNAPTGLEAVFDFLGGLDVADYADIVAYTFDADICVALLQYMDAKKIIKDVEVVASELDEVCKMLSLEFNFKELWEYVVGTKTHDGKYACQPSKLEEEQETYISQAILPLLDYIKNLIDSFKQS